MASWSDQLERSHRLLVRNVAAALQASHRNTWARLADPTARTHGAVGDYPANVASQVSAVRALCDRLDRDRVQHPTNDAA